MLESADSVELPNPALEGWTIWPSIVSNLIGPFWERRVGDHIQLGMVCDARHDNGRGKMHGGLLMILADQGMGAAVRATGDYIVFATIQLDVSFLQAVDIGDFVTTDCHVRHKTSSIIFVSGTLKVGSREIASAQGVFKSLDRAGRKSEISFAP